MKWFKHQSTARNDERLARLEDKAGLEGYGFYFKMLEIVAEIIDSTDRCEVTYSMSRWARQVNVTTKKFLFLSQCCADVGLILVRRTGDDIAVNIPNLLKYRDNHTKNLQATSKQEVEVDKEEEREVEIEKETPKTQAPKPARFEPQWLPTPIGLKQEKWVEWVLYRSKIGKKPKRETWEKQIEFLTGCIAKGLNPDNLIDESIRNGWQGLFEPKGHGQAKFLTAQQQRDENNRRSTAEFLADKSPFFGTESESIEGEFTNA